MDNTQAGVIFVASMFMLIATLIVLVVVTDDEELAEVRPHEYIVCTNCGCSDKE